MLQTIRAHEMKGKNCKKKKNTKKYVVASAACGILKQKTTEYYTERRFALIYTDLRECPGRLDLVTRARH